MSETNKQVELRKKIIAIQKDASLTQKENQMFDQY